MSKREIKANSLNISLAAKLALVTRDELVGSGSPLQLSMLDQFFRMRIGRLDLFPHMAFDSIRNCIDTVEQKAAQYGRLESFSSIAFSLDLDHRANLYYTLFLFSKYSTPEAREPAYSAIIDHIFGIGQEDRGQRVQDFGRQLRDTIGFYRSGKKPLFTTSNLDAYFSRLGLDIQPVFPERKKACPAQRDVKMPFDASGSVRFFIAPPIQRPALPGDILKFQLALPTIRDLVPLPDREFISDSTAFLYGVIYGNLERGIIDAKYGHKPRKLKKLTGLKARVEALMSVLELWTKLCPHWSDEPVNIPWFLVPEVDSVLEASKRLKLMDIKWSK